MIPLEVPVGERLAVVESQIKDLKDWQRETDRTLVAMKDSLNRIEAQMVSQAAFAELKDTLDGVITEQAVKRQVDAALDERDVGRVSFRTSMIKALPAALLAVISILVILNSGHV